MSFKQFLILITITLNSLTVHAIDKAPIILISIDGFANYYLDKYQPKNILALANKGVKAKALLPVYPSKTFPNHLSIVTGVYPVNHGIIHNRFYRRDLDELYYLSAGKDNPAWLTAIPIWTVAEQQGVKTGVYFWPESETEVAGQLPSYYFPYKHNTPNIDRVNQLVSWLKLPKSKRPQLLVSYFSTVDSAGHDFGPNSSEVKQAILAIDNLIGLLVKRLQNEIKQEVNIILVSDHGMTEIDQNAIEIETLITLNSALKVINGQTQLYMYSDNVFMLKKTKAQLLSKINDKKPKYKVYLKNDFPKHWQLNGNQSAIPDLIVEAIPPATFTSHGKYGGAATHGFDPLLNRELDAIFIASGPNFNNKQVIDAFQNIHIFPLLIEMLGLKNNNVIDSNSEVLKSIIKN